MKSRPSLALRSSLVFLACALSSCNPSTGAMTGGGSSSAAYGGGSATGSTSTAGLALDSEESAFVTLINQYRAQNGLGALAVSVKLTQSSKWMSADMAQKNYFSHTDSLGRDPFTRMAAFGYSTYTTAGENIAAGNAGATDTFTQWKNSPAHNANMLESGYGAIGVGRAYDANSAYGWYWTTDFGSSVDAILK